MNETELLFSEVLKCSRTDLYLNTTLSLSRQQAAFVSSALVRRACGEPIHYILGKTEFMGLEFRVTQDVFIPRPETEVLVEAVLRSGLRSREPQGRIKVLDVGTGSGCIAISLTRLLPEADVTALDVSEPALEIARLNAGLHGAEVRFLNRDIRRRWGEDLGCFDAIVSNPPYIKSDEIGTLQVEVKHEPRIALDGGSDGLDFYRAIIRQAPLYLKDRGIIILEMGFQQSGAIQEMLRASGEFRILDVLKDYCAIERVIIAGKR